MINKIIVWLAFLALVFGLVLYGKFEYFNKSLCDELKQLQNDKARSAKIKFGLISYINLPEIQSNLSNSFSGVFNLIELSEPLEPFILDKEFSYKIQNIFIRSNRADNRFIEPYNIQEVGIGLGRSYIVFKNNNNVDSRLICNKDGDSNLMD